MKPFIQTALVKYMHYTGLAVCIMCLYLVAPAQEKPPGTNRFEQLRIREGHPRIWIDRDKIDWLKNKCKGMSPTDVQKIAGPSTIGLALNYVITGDEKAGRLAIARALDKRVDPGSIHWDLGGPDGINKRNAPQATLVDQALCYDWCYPLLSAAQKTEFRDSMVPRMKKYIDFKRTWRSFHNRMYNAAWPVTAGMIALFGDDPYAQYAFDFLKPELEDAMRTFDHVFPDGEWAEGMDYNRHSSYHALRIFLAFKTATGVDLIANSPHFKNTGKYILYASKPNGLALPNDDNDWPYIGPWEHLALLMLNEEYRDGSNQYFINHCPVERFRLEPADQYARLLWYDPTIREIPLNKLPLSRIFRGKGLVLARSSWDWDSAGKSDAHTWLSFHCGDYFGDHTHFDINSFTISHGGELAIDAGRYDDDWGVDYWKDTGDSSRIRLSQFFNYYQRTIAHNTILVKDPDEVIGLNLVNDGGQLQLLRVNDMRNVPEDYDQGNFPSEDGIGTCDWATNPGRWETGDITAYKATADFMYVRGDGTKAYSPAKMKSFVRQMIYLQPDILVVMDRVVTTREQLKKTWLLHSVNEPVIHDGGKSFELTDKEGRLVCVPVLPRNLVVSKVGGPGNEFLVDSVHFKAGMNSLIAPSEFHYGEIAGAWRVEEQPGTPAKEDYFLNVLLISGKNSHEIPMVKVISENDTEISIRVNTKNGRSATIKFTKGDNPTAQLQLLEGNMLRIDEKMPANVLLEDGREP